MFIGTNPTDCPGQQGEYVLPSSLAGNFIEIQTTFLQRTVPVAAGTYSFYVTGQMTTGQDASDEFDWGNMVAVFYPS